MTPRRSTRRWRLWCRTIGAVAETINRSSRFCWVDLALWMVRQTSWVDEGERVSPIRAARDLRESLTENATAVRRCIRDAGMSGVCYCGQFQTAAFQAEHVPQHYKAGAVVPEVKP